MIKGLQKILPFLFPFSIWVFLRRGFLTGNFSFVGDNSQYFFWLQNYLYNIIRGVYPRWNPFFSWGTFDNIDTRIIGDFNPFLQFVNIFHHIGFSFFHAMILFLFIYYLIGNLGFYFLAQRLFKEKRLAYIAFILLMFSSMGAALFQQMQIFFLFTAGVWFFYFLVGFAQTMEKKYFLGITFSSMVLVTTYMPFHFLTIFLIFILFFSIFYLKEFGRILKRSGGFISKNKILTIFCTMR